MDSGLIGESLRLMVIGMTIVFFFLMLLVVCLRGMSWFAARVAPAEGPETLSAGPIRSDAGAPGDGDLVAVISAAIARYRARHPD